MKVVYAAALSEILFAFFGTHKSSLRLYFSIASPSPQLQVQSYTCICTYWSKNFRLDECLKWIVHIGRFLGNTVFVLSFDKNINRLTVIISIQIEDVELKPGGSEIEVTESNKKEYIKWVCSPAVGLYKYLMVTGMLILVFGNTPCTVFLYLCLSTHRVHAHTHMHTVLRWSGGLRTELASKWKHSRE